MKEFSPGLKRITRTIFTIVTMQTTNQNNNILGLLFGGANSRKKSEAKKFYNSRLKSNYANLLFYETTVNEAFKLYPFYQEQNQTGSEIITRSNITSKHGEPNFISIFEAHDHQIVINVYRAKVIGINAKIEFHFIDNYLFYYNYVFEFLNKSDKEEILKTINGKYKLVNKNSNECLLLGESGNVVYLQDDVVFRINYFNPGNPALKQVVEIAKSNRLQAENKTRVDLKMLLNEL